MFEKETPNRRLTSKEFEEELKDAAIWGHYPRLYIKDKPFYKDLPPTPLVNFDLGWKK